MTTAVLKTRPMPRATPCGWAGDRLADRSLRDVGFSSRLRSGAVVASASDSVPLDPINPRARGSWSPSTTSRCTTALAGPGADQVPTRAPAQPLLEVTSRNRSVGVAQYKSAGGEVVRERFACLGQELVPGVQLDACPDGRERRGARGRPGVALVGFVLAGLSPLEVTLPTPEVGLLDIPPRRVGGVLLELFEILIGPPVYRRVHHVGGATAPARHVGGPAATPAARKTEQGNLSGRVPRVAVTGEVFAPAGSAGDVHEWSMSRMLRVDQVKARSSVW